MPFEQDSTGQWWYWNCKQRTKCQEYTCEKCGRSFYRIPSQVKGKSHLYCSRVCSNIVTSEKQKITRKGKNNPAWKNGHVKTGQGYVRANSPDHPFREKRHNSVLEHRLVMEKKIGRYLRPYENVHHINGIRDDNRPENLELWVTMQPSGQRPADLVKWAREILKAYGDEYPAPAVHKPPSIRK